LDPGTDVALHRGFTNLRLRWHLGLVIPTSCGIVVGGEERTWEEGELLLFDDSCEHRVWNHSNSIRGVLIFDIWHPELDAVEVAAIRTVQNVWRRFSP